MSKIKAKLTALLMAAACCLACIGIGVSMNKSDQVVASAATVEELTAEFTNNGQFTVGQFRDDMPFEIVDSTTEGVPEGASGAVLKITGVGDDTTSSGGAFATLDFTAAGLYRSGVDVIVRVYQPSNFSFRVSKKANNADWTTQATPAAGWQEVTLSGAANATEDHQIMTTMSMGLRRGTECYIDSITVVDNAAKQEFTNNGQFDVKQYSTNRAYYVDGSAEGLPEGYTGTVLKLDVGSTQYVTFDFTGANLLETDVLSMTAKCYLPNAYTNSAGTATYTDSSYQVRLGNIENSAGGYGEYNMSTWFDANINVNHAQFAKDENGYLTTVIFGLRNKGNTASYFYIDGITVNMVEYDIVQVGAVESYATTANATRVDRLYLKPTDQTVAWYGANENFTYVSGTGLQVIRNGEVVATLKPTLANRNTAAGKDSNVKHFYLTISSLTLQAGDIVKYGGIYQNSTVGMRYVIEDSEILWDGISWGKNEAYSEPSAITKLKPVTPSITATGASNKAVYLKMKSGEALPFQSWENAWVYESGTGLKVNGESVTMKSMQSAPEGIYITFDELTAGDVVTFGGTFRCPAQKIKYTIEDSNFVWNGSIWEPEYTVYNVGDVNFRIVGGTGNRYVYLHPINKTGFDTTTWNSGWDAKFSWKDGTGITLNGETVSGASIKFPGDFFIDLGAAPQVGDILRVGGTYYNVSLAKEYIINEAAFIYDGTKWDKYVEYTTHELTGLTLYGNSATTDKANAGKLHLKASGFAHPAEAMIFTLESGIGLAVNDQQITWTTFKNSVDKYLYLTFNALNVGDKLTIGGTFVCEEKAVKYIIEETNFWWNGTSWQTEEYVINYTAHELGVLAVHPHSDGTTGNVPNATQLYMKVAVGTAPAIPADGNNGWDTSFELTSGDGWKVNGTSVTVGALLNTNSGFYVNLANAGIKAGDILTVSGTFSNATVATKYVIEESTFIWAGTAWLNYVEPTTYNIGKLAIDGGSSATAINFKKVSGEAFEVIGGWNELIYYVGGTGITLNGTQIKMNDIKIPNNMYVGLGTTAVAGDELVIGGEFYSSALQVKYVVRDTKFVFDGANWNYVTDYTEVNLGKLTTKSNDNTNAERIYMKTEGDNKFVDVVPDYIVMTYASGTQVLVNGEAREYTRSQAFDSYFYLKISPGAEIGDKVTFGGVFVNEEYKIEYTIEDSDFWWNGTTWQTEPYIVYTTYELGQLSFSDLNEGNAKFPQFNHASSAEIPNDPNWLAYTCEEGVGAKLNGANVGAIKFPGLVFIEFTDAPQEGDILVIGGTFYNAETALKFVIDETTLWWNGTAWTTERFEVQYTTYTLGEMIPRANSVTDNDPRATQLYMKMAEGETPAIPSDSWHTYFVLESGDGWKVNGESVTVGHLLNTAAGFYTDIAAANIKVGDVLTVSGTFSNEATATKYVITESKFIWNGSFWEVEGQYTTYTVKTVGSTKDSSATVLYLYTIEGDALPKAQGDWDTKYTYAKGSGKGLLLNGETITGGDKKLPGDFYMQLGTTANVNDVVTIDGIYFSATKGIKIVFVDCQLTFNGTKWINVYTDEQLEAYDYVSLYDINMGTTWNVNGEISSHVQRYFAPSAENSTNSVVFGFNYTATQDLPDDGIGIRLRHKEWTGFTYRFTKNGLELQGSGNMVMTLETNKTYKIELAAIDLANGSGTWCYIKIDGVIMCATVIAKTENTATYVTNQVSLYAAEGVHVNMTDIYSVSVTYQYLDKNGVLTSYSDAVNKNYDYTLASGKGHYVFIGWADENGNLYQAGENIGIVEENMTFTAVEVDFAMEYGAAIRIDDTADTSGLRFTTILDSNAIRTLADQYGFTFTFGTLIMPFDYLDANQAPNLTDFVVDQEILKIESTATLEEDDGYCGIMQKVIPENYGRLFAGRGYMEITLNGETWTIYTKFDADANVRSVRYVAQQFVIDTEEYNNWAPEKQAIADAYATAPNGITLMPYSKYANNQFEVTAWYYPELDPSNAYNNATNIAIAKKLTDAGITAVYLDGEYHLDLNTVEKIERTRQIINFFWSQGLKTIAFGSNAGVNMKGMGYNTVDYPDFSDCEGFMGFLVWDEPQTVNFETLKAFAQNFEKMYAGTDVTFMVNLLPSYASCFNGTSNWWESSLSSLKKDTFEQYLKDYCDIVLSEVSGEKWLSLDTYPINADKTLTGNFLFDLAMLKYYAEYAGATSHAVLQSSGWKEGNNESKYRMPTAAEMEMQAYAAMAFGIDSISWWSYSDKRFTDIKDSEGKLIERVDNQENPTDKDAYYNNFAAVNNELDAISQVYSAFDWKGVILGMGKDNGSSLGSWVLSEDQDYAAYKLVDDEIGKYQLTANDTKNLSSVATNKTNWNYLMGVMEDMHGNEGYVLCNYNSHEEDRAQTITLTFKTNVTKVVIYRNGVAETVDVTGQTLKVNLATGEGVIILPSKLG